MYQLNGKQDELCLGERMRPRVLVSAPRRNQLWHGTGGPHPWGRKRRDDEGVIASTRGACAPRMPWLQHL